MSRSRPRIRRPTIPGIDPAVRSIPVSVKTLLWSALIALALGTGLIYFPRDYPGMGFWQALYSTLQLFVLSPSGDHFPRSWPLVVIYFAAPAISLSAAGTAISYLFRLTPMVRTRWLTDHVVICGVGRSGKLLMEALVEQGVAAVGIDRGPAEDFADWRRGRRRPIFFGDFNARSLLVRARADHARALVFVSGDDLANLEGAIGAYEWLRTPDGAPRLIWIHIANERLRAIARRVVVTEGRVGLRFFDTYQIAAVKMIDRYFGPERRAQIREVNVIGFGKFGRDLLENLVRSRVPEESFTLRVVDMADRERAVMDLARELGVADRTSFTRAAVQELTLEEAADRAFFLCTDDDLGNLTAAMMLAARCKAGNIFVRMAQWPLAAMAERLGEDCGVTFINLNELVGQGLPQLPGLFSPAAEDDLKRRRPKDC
jgi:Trk K+ transport system NAD-binding subunit